MKPLIIRMITLGIFLNSFLLFLLQPYVGKLLLPIFGGTATVWSVVLVFFQGCLLLGYGICYGASYQLKREKRVLFSYSLLILLACFYSFRVSPDGATIALIPTAPMRQLLWMLCGAFLVPAIILSSGSTLYQRCASRLYASDDPYRLYAASNAGSFCALLCYPFLVEPFFTTQMQAELIRGGFCLNACLLLATMAKAYSSRTQDDAESTKLVRPQMAWIVIPASTSGLLIAVTAHLSTNIAPIPLLWIVPLFLFLLSYTVSFSSIAEKVLPQSALLIRISVLAILFSWFINLTDPLWLASCVYVLLFFAICVSMHARLFASRPTKTSLPFYYLCIAAGGFIGGCIVNFLSPLVLNDMYELPLILVGCVAAFSGEVQVGKRFTAFLVVLTICTSMIYYASEQAFVEIKLLWLTIIAIAYILDTRLSVLALRLLLVTACSFALSRFDTETIFAGRNFYGVLKVKEKDDFRILVHGVTYHGQQQISSRDHCAPSSYYYPTGPAGTVLRKLQSVKPKANIGIIGVGTAALACYRTDDQHLELFEINPLVMQLAEDPTYFTFMQHAVRKDDRRHIGDARISLQTVPDGSLNLLILDAFNSDAIPTHLLTVEAMQEYHRVLGEEGLLLVHISNKYLDLFPIIAAGGKTIGYESYVWNDDERSEDEIKAGKDSSQWALLGISSDQMRQLVASTGWRSSEAVSTMPWSDQYSSVAKILLWK